MKELLELKKTNGIGKVVNENLFQNPKLLIEDAVFVRHEGSLVKVRFEDILWLKGDGNYTTIIAKKAVFSVRNILKDFEYVLPENQFLRIHKSYIVQVSEILSISNKEVKVGNDLLPIGRTFYHQLLSGIKKLGSIGD
ncbi:MAG: LytTR family DNA-binding domain-containing protein [Bacteroidetes bacterium]|nr:LytTR family DNA-binding domain-containing protein [Bacteroidota bacterium]